MTFVQRLFLCKKGTAGLEFAITAPILLGGLIIMTDIGLAINAQMNLDQAVKSGAQFVMSDVTDIDSLEDLMSAAATGSDPNAPNHVSSEGDPAFDATQICKCPGSESAVSCTGLCSSDQTPPRIYYDLTGTQTYSAMALPDFDLTATIRVQTR